MKLKHVVLLVAVLLLDQLTKWGIQSTIDLNESIEIIPGFFSLTYVHNTGAAWSMLEGKMIFFYIITIIFLIGMVYFYRTLDKQDWLSRIGVVLMIAGALGNFVDRLFLQYVRDFLDFIILGYDFPVFNVADISLCVGVGCIVLSMLLEYYGGFKKCAK
ncbi:signal peptidase II [Erysipelotrichaceae bacterium HCN-30851]